jgi:DNA polymerase III alpha subunit
MKIVTDIDIDFADREAALADLLHIPASMYQDGDLKRHNVGVYFQSIPQDPQTGLASIEYKSAEERGYFKIDFLNLTVYKGVRDEAHLDELIQREPLWDMLDESSIVEQLFHISGHFDVVSRMKPRSILQLAMVLAMIRPGKRHLVGRSWAEVEADIWNLDLTDAYAFKKAHAVSYAMVLVVQMNLMVEALETESEPS